MKKIDNAVDRDNTTQGFESQQPRACGSLFSRTRQENTFYQCRPFIYSQKKVYLRKHARLPL